MFLVGPKPPNPTTSPSQRPANNSYEASYSVHYILDGGRAAEYGDIGDMLQLYRSEGSSSASGSVNSVVNPSYPHCRYSPCYQLPNIPPTSTFSRRVTAHVLSIRARVRTAVPMRPRGPDDFPDP